MAIDVDAYFSRLNYHGSRAPTLDTLRALHLSHLNAIPFENLDVLLGRTVRIDPASIESKFIHDRRGGYCFEQNTLFTLILRALGFTVTPHLARIRWQKPAGERTPLVHLILRVPVDGIDWLVDVGLGGVGSTAPLALDTDREQITPHEPRRIVQEGARFMHRMRVADLWSDVYEFTLDDVQPVDLEIANWYSCSHPQAHFMNNLLVTKIDGDRRITLFNRELTFRPNHGLVERRELTSPEELLEILAQHFGLPFPAETRFGRPGAIWPT